MTELKARKKAEAWADSDIDFWRENIRFLSDKTPWNNGLHLFVEELFRRLQCYRDMTSGPAQGWISEEDRPFLFNKSWAEEAKNRTFSLITYKDFRNKVPVKLIEVKEK